MPESPRVAVIIPCYNEETTVAATVLSFRKTLPEASIYVFDNNSTDNTELAAKAAGATVVFSPLVGKGNVMIHAFKEIEADFYIICDGDGTYPAEMAPEMLAELRRKEVDMVVGARLALKNARSFSWWRWLGNLAISWLVSHKTQTTISDLLSGYRVFSRDIVKNLKLDSAGFEIETELTLKAIGSGYKTSYCNVDYHPRQGGGSKLNFFKDGIRILRFVMKEQAAENGALNLLGLFLIVASVFFLFFRAKAAFFVGNVNGDDGCYVNYLYQLLHMPSPIHCRFTSYPPGIALAWLPAGVIALLLSHLLPFSFDLLLSPLIGSMVFAYWAACLLLLYKMAEKRSISQPTLFLLSIPILYYATFRNTLVHVPELFFAFATVAAVQWGHLRSALLLAAVVASMRIADAPIFIVVLAAIWEQKPARYLKWLAALLLALVSVWALKMLLVDGYNGKFLGDLIATISWRQVLQVILGTDSGVIWFSPWWLCCLLFAAINIPRLSWPARAAFLWMFLEFLVICAWGENGSDFGYRYLLGSFAGAWLLSRELALRWRRWGQFSIGVQLFGLAILLPVTWLYRMSIFTSPHMSGRTISNPTLVFDSLGQLSNNLRMIEPLRYSPLGTAYYSVYYPHAEKYAFPATPEGRLYLGILIILAILVILAVILTALKLVRTDLNRKVL